MNEYQWGTKHSTSTLVCYLVVCRVSFTHLATLVGAFLQVPCADGPSACSPSYSSPFQRASGTYLVLLLAPRRWGGLGTATWLCKNGCQAPALLARLPVAPTSLQMGTQEVRHNVSVKWALIEPHVPNRTAALHAATVRETLYVPPSGSRPQERLYPAASVQDARASYCIALSRV